jgi:predicted nucleotide-binding protein (sugar kinase/HSP70/actin superfamily)
VAKHLERLLGDRPRLLLEFDEHRGEAGLVTRLEAFADEIDEHLRRQRAAGVHGTPRTRRDPPTLVAPSPDRPTSPAVPGPRTRRILVPNFGHPAKIYAGALRGAGFAVVLLPAPDADTVRLGEKESSGRECHPWTIIAGELAQCITEQGAAAGDVFLSPTCVTSCLLRQYGDAYGEMLARRGLGDVAVWKVASPELGAATGPAGKLRFYQGLAAADALFTLAVRLRPYVVEPGAADRQFEAAVDALSADLAARRGVGAVLGAHAAALLALPRRGDPGELPVVGVTGDLYTRIHPLGNGQLFARLEALGCEVWPSPYFAELVDLASHAELRRHARRARLRRAAHEGFVFALSTGLRRALRRHLPAQVRRLVEEPAPARMMALARPYVGPQASFLIVNAVAKLVDFVSRGAAGAINAAGMNCMVGTATAAAAAAIQADHGAPVATLIYGGDEGPAQRIRLETFVHQVHQRKATGALDGGRSAQV